MCAEVILIFAQHKKKCYFFTKVKLISVSFFFMKSTLSLGITFVEECYSDTRFIALFYVKKEVSTETIFIFIFYCATVSRENWMKLAVLFSEFLAQKLNWVMVSWYLDAYNYETVLLVDFTPKTAVFCAQFQWNSGGCNQFHGSFLQLVWNYK